jgi:hypothetical protein
MILPIKFKEDPNVVEIHNDIFLYKNFLDPELLSDYRNKLDSFSENDWHQHGNFEIGDHEETFWGDKCSLDVIDYVFHDPIFNFFAPNYWMYQHANFVRLDSGQSSPVDDNTSFYVNDYKIADYKVALYLGEFEGGEISFPELDFKYKPEENDLLIFKVDKTYSHETLEVTSGTRYAYIDCLIPHPGYFMP